MADSSGLAVLITCEHGGNQIPQAWQHVFAGAEPVLETHRGYDPGALELAQRFSRELQVPLVSSTVSRLLVELNRSPGHPQLFSEFTRDLADSQQQQLLHEYYEPYRREVQDQLSEFLQTSDRVVHLSVHSFTPVWDGVERPIDVGLLYDPRRSGEKGLCDHWLQALKEEDPTLRVRRNAPYKGTSDGLVTFLRKVWGPDEYIGLELEVNQRFPLEEPQAWRPLQATLIESFLQALDSVSRV